MDKRYIVIMGEGIEETYAIPVENTAAELKALWKAWGDDLKDENSFDVWVSEKYPNFEIERIFTEAIYI